MTFDFTLLINKMLYLNNLKSDSTQNWNAFWKIIVQDKCQVSKNFKQSFLRYIENTTGSVSLGILLNVYHAITTK